MRFANIPHMNTLLEISQEPLIGSARNFVMDKWRKHTGTYICIWIDRYGGGNTMISAKLIWINPFDLSEEYQQYSNQVGSGNRIFHIDDWNQWESEDWVHIWTIYHAFALESIRTENPQKYVEGLKFAIEQVLQCMDSGIIDTEVARIMKSCKKMEWGDLSNVDEVNTVFFQDQLRLRADIRKKELIRINIDREMRSRIAAIQQRRA